MHACLTALWAVARTPPLLHDERALATLLAPPAASGGDAADPDDAVRLALALLARLARLPRSPWKNTCLYRATVECLVLRGRGGLASVRIGVARSSADGIMAHAWAIAPGRVTITERLASTDHYNALSGDGVRAGS